MTHPLVDKIRQLADELAAEYENPARAGTADDFARSATDRLRLLARDERPRRLVPNLPADVRVEFERRYDAGERVQASRYLRERMGCTVSEALDHVHLWALRRDLKLETA